MRELRLAYWRMRHRMDQDKLSQLKALFLRPDSLMTASHVREAILDQSVPVKLAGLE